MKIKYTPKFYEKLEEIAAYIFTQSQSNQTTSDYIKGLQEHIEVSLTSFPQMGRPAEEFGNNIRKLVHKRYSILYKIDENYILVITIYRENLPKL
ncbi:MAG TPA: type II toxin-antitoxin system RelE/ParE family toxin [Epsilonproteobacteria bacterium]|nr:type II toxin-antitoxin system RelE/ParE family toxin [Campylobacterota bacterium]